MNLARLACPLVFAVAACAPAPALHTADPGLPVLLVGVVGLQADDPLLDRLPDGVHRAPDVLASGMGASAALALLDGRPAVEQLRAPRDPLAWTGARDLSSRVFLMDPSLRSEPEWGRSGVAWLSVDAFPAPGEADLQVVLVPRALVDEARLTGWLRPDPSRVVVVAGIPAAPDRQRRRNVGGDPDVLVGRLEVPVLAADPRVAVNDCRVLEDVLAPLRGEPRSGTAPRTAAWWNAFGGGVLRETGDRYVVTGTNRQPVIFAPGTAPETIDPARATAALGGAIPKGDLLVMVRGSASVDLVAIEILTGPDPGWSGWGLEAIDAVEQPSQRLLRLDLAAEPQGDGILLEDLVAQAIAIQLLTTMEDEPVVGAPIRDAASGDCLGIDTLQLNPWSRNFWRLTRRTEFDAASWWRASPAGIDLLWLPEGTAAPDAVELPD